MFRRLFRSCPDRPTTNDDQAALWISLGVVIFFNMTALAA